MTNRRRAAPRGTTAFVLLASLVGLSDPSAATIQPVSVEARISAGYDANLLDASNTERAAFANRDPSSLFVVSAMEDQFLEGGVRVAWRPPRLLAGRPSVKLAYQRRQYLHNPIKSTDAFAMEGRVRPATRTRLDFSVEFLPQIYGRHRRNDEALPGEPQFRSEVHRRWDVAGSMTQGLSSGTDLTAGLEGSSRDYRSPFDARDRHLAGGSAGVSQSVTRGLRIGLGGGYRKTWSRNEPGIPTDLSNREWGLSAWLEVASTRLAASLETKLELSRRHYTSSDPQDDTHFGRDDRRGDLEIELKRSVLGPVDSVTRFVRRWRGSDIPGGDYEDDAFSDTEIQTGLSWSGGSPGREGQ